MKRACFTLMALVIVFSLSCNLLLAQDSERKIERVKEIRIEGERNREYESKPIPDKRDVQQKKMARNRKRKYDKLLSELELQRREIHALREEIAALRRMLEDQYAIRRAPGSPAFRGDTERREGGEDLRRLQPERRDVELRPEINREIRELEENLKHRPDDAELHERLANLYREVNRIEAAIKHYKEVLRIKPDYDPPYRALRELGYRFPDEPREKDIPLEDSIGEVISSSEKEVKLKTLEGDVVTYTVPSWQRDDGSLAPDEKISKLAKSLDVGAKVKILWRNIEGHRVIQRLEYANTPEKGGT